MSNTQDPQPSQVIPDSQPSQQEQVITEAKRTELDASSGDDTSTELEPVNITKKPPPKKTNGRKTRSGLSFGIDDEDDRNILINGDNKMNNNNNFNDINIRSQGGLSQLEDFEDYYKSYKEQVQELRREHPDFEVKERFERVIFNKIPRRNLGNLAVKGGWTLEQFDEYCLTRNVLEAAITEDMGIYLTSMIDAHNYEAFISTEGELKIVEKELKDAVKEGDEQSKDRLIKTYDDLVEDLTKIAATRPALGKGNPLCRVVRGLTLTQYKKFIKTGLIVVMDTNPKKKVKKVSFSPSTTLISKKVTGKRKKPSSTEVRANIQTTLSDGKPLTGKQRKELLDLFKDINDKQDKEEEKRGHIEAQKVKDKIEISDDADEINSEDDDDQPPPSKRRRLTRSEKRLRDARRQTENEAELFFHFLYICVCVQFEAML